MPQPDRVETEAEALVVIHEAGYTDVRNLEQHGATWHCDALNATGQDVRLVIDGAGKVHEQGQADEPEAQPKA